MGSGIPMNLVNMQKHVEKYFIETCIKLKGLPSGVTLILPKRKLKH
jgi:hypothetical protein